MKSIKLIECPRDAMQGWKNFIPTAKKVAYINSLLQVGFDTIDFGSFVSAKAIPQMSDTHQVVSRLKIENSKTKLLAIVANLRGAQEACEYDEISYIGFPFSISETFQQLNANASISEALSRVQDIQHLCLLKDKQLVVYISMGFGNPYGDPFPEELVFKWVDQIVKMGITIISLADTVGVADALQINGITGYLIKALPSVEIGVHLHSTSLNWKEKTEAAFTAGCTRFDGALKGIGGCPMAMNELVGNMNTEWMVDYFKNLDVLPALNMEALQNCISMADEIFI